VDWIGLSSVLRPRQHSIGYTGDGFYRSKDPTNSIKVLWVWYGSYVYTRTWLSTGDINSETKALKHTTANCCCMMHPLYCGNSIIDLQQQLGATELRMQVMWVTTCWHLLHFVPVTSTLTTKTLKYSVIA